MCTFLFVSLLQVFQSCIEGINKPNPEAYQLVLQRLGVEANETIFLDDIGKNLKSAKQLGIETIKVITIIIGLLLL